MRSTTPFLLTAAIALTACAADQPPQIADLVPDAGTDRASVQEASQTVAMGFDQTYSTNWSCRWNGPEASWSLPVVDVEEGEAYAFNEWTRLEGVVRNSGPETSGAARKLELRGERRSEDGGWYAMTMVGPVYADRVSTLRGYWKGGLCEAQLTPIRTGADEEESA